VGVMNVNLNKSEKAIMKLNYHKSLMKVNLSL